jgi:hypothetical protein
MAAWYPEEFGPFLILSRLLKKAVSLLVRGSRRGEWFSALMKVMKNPCIFPGKIIYYKQRLALLS